MKLSRVAHRLAVALCGLLLVLGMSAQENRDYKYGDKYAGYDKSGVRIHHKAAKWYGLRGSISESSKLMDTFSDGEAMFWHPWSADSIQSAHTYTDTFYVHKGTYVDLDLPDKIEFPGGFLSSTSAYQRWYSFRTDGTFRTKNSEADGVWDLLMPINTVPYRFSNGYVGKPETADPVVRMKFYVPTDEEFDRWFGEEGHKFDNNYYLVCCDVSGYTDYIKQYDLAAGNPTSHSSTEQSGRFYEPTLGHRVIYYIVAVDGRDDGVGATEHWKYTMGRLKNPDYQGGKPEGKYLEEYDISYPFTRVSNKTNELVTLSKDARAYAVPDATDDHGVLDVRLIDGGSGVALDNTTLHLEGTSKVIRFIYPNMRADETRYVNGDNSTATILVTKTVGGTVYNIAKFNLRFVRNCRLLTQTQLEQIENGTIEDSLMRYFQFRTDSYLAENYKLLTKLDFDYDPELSNIYGRGDYYPFPLQWNFSSYTFYDGSKDGFMPSTGTRYYPEWGCYSIRRNFIEQDFGETDTVRSLPNSTYHMYIDASDRPGTIARLPFRENLCAGSEMFVTAWVKSGGYDKTIADDAGMLFSIMGVTDSIPGQTVYEPICRHATGQIRRTDYMNGAIPGTGPGKNEWMQVYFSFILKNNADYDSYVLQIDNYSNSTNGGDMYIDDIRVYIGSPKAEVRQLTAACTNERTLMNMKFDWNRLISKVGVGDVADRVEGVDFCFIDEQAYNEFLASHPGDYAGAIDSAVVEIGNNEVGEDYYNAKYNTLHFHTDFASNTVYTDRPHPRLPSDNMSGGKYFFYRTPDTDDTRSLLADFYSALVPNKLYTMLMVINDGDSACVENFASDINSPCAMKTQFYVVGQTLIRINGEVADPSLDVCAGKNFNFSMQMRVPVENADGTVTYVDVEEDVAYDWFFGREAEFRRKNPAFGDVTLEEAINRFRDEYPLAKRLDGIRPTQSFTADMLAMLRHYAETEAGGGTQYNRLVLRRSNIDVTVQESGIEFVVQPIPIDIDSLGVDKAKICWSYVPLAIKASGLSPILKPGFNSLKYPTGEFVPGLRIGLKQIRETSPGKTLTVNLRDARYTSDKVKSLGKIETVTPELYERIYLVGTDDPAYDDFFTLDFSEFSLPIGTLDYLYAEEHKDGSAFKDSMRVYFDTETVLENGFRFDPKEGYTYTFAVHFEEHGDVAYGSCFGTFAMDMKVVPEYLVWQGDNYSGNWNNDDNWRRADVADLKKPVGDSYPTNDANTTSHGFVPMLFTNVVLPRDSRIELYMAGYREGGNAWHSPSRPEHIEKPTDNIQYDLMAFEREARFKTERYRVNICRDMHFEAGARMLHAEEMLYNRAWMEVTMPTRSWQMLAMPLRDVFAGDWYTTSATGRQQTEYFKDITFDAATNNRLSPAVYQRSWDSGATIIEDVSEPGLGTNVSFSKTDWSSAYNDASVEFAPGTGFLLKAVAGTMDTLTFRFPKADASYDVATGELHRDRSGRLLATSLLDRSDPLVYAPDSSLSVDLGASLDGMYYVIGNPFMADLDLAKFFDENSNLYANYWTAGPDGPVAGSAGTTGWTTVTADGRTVASVPPFGAFFVRMKDKSVPRVVFKADMQMFAERQTTGKVFTVSAAAEGGRSSAAVVYDGAAGDGYDVAEDVVLLRDAMTSGNVPMVYTVGGGKALAVNRLSDLRMIPLGVFAPDNTALTLTFDGVASLEAPVLYDAVEKVATPIYDGMKLTVGGQSHGRYFIRTQGAATGVGNALEAPEVSVYSVERGTVCVASESAIVEVAIYAADGTRLALQTPGNERVCTMRGLRSGVAIARVKTADGTFSNQFIIR